MKKNIFVVSALSLFLFSCQKESIEIAQSNSENSIDQIITNRDMRYDYIGYACKDTDAHGVQYAGIECKLAQGECMQLTGCKPVTRNLTNSVREDAELFVNEGIRSGLYNQSAFESLKAKTIFAIESMEQGH
jgi:hypothetical protein